MRAFRIFGAAVTVALPMLTFATSTFAADATMPAATDFNAILASHPAAETLKTFFDEHHALDASAGDSKRADYLPLIAGNVDYWKHFQDEQGAIVDPYERLERQYSTPAFTLAAATLVASAKRDDLLDTASRAMTWSLWCLANKRTADQHSDFYIPMLMHASRILRPRVSADLARYWDAQLRSLNAETTYRSTRPGGNWNLVHVSGEWMRRKDGLVVPEQLDAQRKYLDHCIDVQLRSFTPLGMYIDPNSPLAYDAFPRLWLEDMIADGAYEGGEHRTDLERTLTLGGLSTLLLVSPSGEWPSGGRSAQHQWNEAEVAVISEINAVRWQRAGRPDIAGSFKRAAQLSRESMSRWQRGSGEFWIVKNFADPGRRFGFMTYSFNSQYNLLAVAMLSIAYERADDSIAPTPLPSEAGSYVFDVRQAFHHVAGAAGGYYVWIDTATDPDHGSTGLQRVHRAGVALSPLTDTAAPHLGMGPADERVRLAMSPGIEWRDASNHWQSLAAFGTRAAAPATRPASRTSTSATTTATTRPTMGDNLAVTSADLDVDERTASAVRFTLRYTLAPQTTARSVEEHYAVSSQGVDGATSVEADGPLRVVLPVLVNDGARDLAVSITGSSLSVTREGAPAELPVAVPPPARRPGGTLNWQLLEPAGLSLARVGPQVVTHNGYVEAVAAELPPGVRSVRWHLTLEPNTAGPTSRPAAE